MINILSR